MKMTVVSALVMTGVAIGAFTKAAEVFAESASISAVDAARASVLKDMFEYLVAEGFLLMCASVIFDTDIWKLIDRFF